MCGICGILTKREITPVEIERIAAVNRGLSHRGPDDNGTYSDEHIVLGMRRLSIIDLDGGHQPLYNEDRSLVLIANGEIYNFIELRRYLETRGHRFNTRTDCETILHLYEEYDLDFVKYLRGMFAFALWDIGKQRLILGRDRLGEKPLYLYEREGQLLFASEMKALLRSDVVPFELDPDSVNLYFHYQYVPEPRTLLKNVRKLDAAQILVLDVASWRITERSYWSMLDAPPLPGDPALLIRERLEEACELTTRADVPIGVALSGGLDSSAVAAFAALKRSGDLHAFSVGYHGRPGSDERAEAKALADNLNIPFQEIEIETSTVVDFFPQLNYWCDDPVADISGYGYYAVMKLARDHGVPVMLQGQGGDELFWGYPLLRQAALESLQKDATRGQTISALPKYLLFQSPMRIARHELGGWARDIGGLLPGWRRFHEHRRTPAEQMVFYDLQPDYLDASREMSHLYSEQFLAELKEGAAAQLFTFPLPWSRPDIVLTYLCCATYLRGNGITQGDRLSMASSVEMRLPLLDYKLVETVIGLRKRETDVRQPAKAWLKDALRGLIPEAIIKRGKRGFTPPARDWHAALFAAYGDTLRDGYLIQSKILNRESSERLAKGPFNASATSPLSFKALVLEHWCRAMADIKGSKGQFEALG